MTKVSDNHKKIYNTHLVISRKVKNLPFKEKKIFDDLQEDTIVTLYKLERFFNAHQSISIDNFFKAPYKIYDDEEYFPLEYFTKLKAITCYTNYMNMLNFGDPDSSELLTSFSNSLKFVFKFCKDNNLTLEAYKTYTLGAVPIFIEHLKSRKITYYTLHALTFSKIGLESDILNFAFNDFWKTFQVTRNKYNASKKMKTFGTKVLETIKYNLKQHDIY